MAIPATYSVFRRTNGDFPRTIEMSTETMPSSLDQHDVLIKIHAVSLNYRDVAFLVGSIPVEIEDRGIPCSDCAAEVIRTGPAVTEFAAGDRVSAIFDLNHIDRRDDNVSLALGGNVSGVLREYAVFEDKYLVKLPKHLTWEEGSMLACAGVTAWNALGAPTSLPSTCSAFLQGTGGVSMFALTICLAAGIEPIITSSTNEKIESIKSFNSKVHGINYKTTSDLQQEVRRITNGRGVDVVLNNAGPSSVAEDIQLLTQWEGTISLVGVMNGYEAGWNPSAILGLLEKSAKIQGIRVGSRKDFQQLNQFLEEKNVTLTHLLDRVFPFSESAAAFEYLRLGKHVGKIVVQVAA
ncbi:alcohol dehydrogenase [Colletotrichum paranaense]|uniref:Alcohol dehydrogenase n=1 Tax=Colletotrichum paranaense TaxID=1914294 RepID=A0ABQ9T5B6_9PEZI|nr:alcohol dehydrogenase [Colletotrichum paranaense]KAK1546977.1 alcohol dehydrogenase [Colletotrichum paranaense]